MAILISCAVPLARLRADAGVGVVLGTPALFTSIGLSGSEVSHDVFAYHLENGTSARVIVVYTTSPVGPTPYDDVIVDASVLSIDQDPQIQGLWNVDLNVVLPNTGAVSLHLEDWRRTNSGATCEPWYSLRSPSRSMSVWGNVEGTINGDPVISGICTAWGSDIYGYHTIWPIGSRVVP